MSDRARRAAKIYYENLGKISKGEAMRRAGFSEHTSKTPQVATVQDDWQDIEAEFIDKLDLETSAALEEADKKREKANYADCVNSVEKLMKLRQLLTGKATDRVEETFSDIVKNAQNRIREKKVKKVNVIKKNGI